jgi:hypothetical protein
MSWEHERYHASCAACGHEGIVIESSDDWGRSARQYEGFDNIGADLTAVGRKRQDIRQNSAQCHCGSTSIIRGQRCADPN